MQFPNGATIIVTDGSNLRVLRNAGDELQLRLEELPAPKLHTHHGSAHHHGSEGNTTHRNAVEGNHAAAVAEWLNHEVLGNRIQSLYVVAPPRALGDLRPLYHATTRARLLGEMGKEHVQDPLDRLKAVLAAA